MKHILIASVNAAESSRLIGFLSPEYEVETTDSAELCRKYFQKKRYEIVFIDIEILADFDSRGDLQSALGWFWELYPTMEIVVLAPPNRLREAVNAVKLGAANYILYPIERDEVRFVIDNISHVIKVQSELDYLRDAFWNLDALEKVQTNSPEMRTVFENIRTVAPTKSTVLLTGETGTGKGVVAKLIHQHSNRKDGPFIGVHLGAIPESLVESELFGHEKGAFTGADRRTFGKFEIARDGTIFLDEIGTISHGTQVKLLQVLQDGTFSRVGGETELTSNARVIAATNANLAEMCEDGRFRKDLFFRLNVFAIDLPPLRGRTRDIPLLVETILRRLNQTYRKSIRALHPDVMDAFIGYRWPGNIRELENIMERSYLLETSSTIMPHHVPPDLFVSHFPPLSREMDLPTLAVVRQRGVESVEKRYLLELLTAMKGRIDKTAHVAGITTRQLNKLMKKYNLKKETFKHP